MAGSREKIKRIFIIINFIGIALIAFFGYQSYNNLNNKKAEQEEITKEYQTLMNDESIGLQEINDINQKIEELKNVDETISKRKENVFKLASQLEHKIKSGSSKYKIAYLTFDDGPYYNTYKVLDILKKNKVKATFFTTTVNGTYCYDNKKANCQELYKEYAKANHTIANHTYTHGWNRGLYRSTQNFITAIKQQEDLIKSKTGIVTNIARFPGGSGTPRAQGGKSRLNDMIVALRNNGYGWVDWTAQDGDGGSLTSKEQAWKNLKSSINESIEVVLFHDYHQITTAILPEFITYLRERNYILLPLFYDSVMINK